MTGLPYDGLFMALADRAKQLQLRCYGKEGEVHHGAAVGWETAGVLCSGGWEGWACLAWSGCFESGLPFCRRSLASPTAGTGCAGLLSRRQPLAITLLLGRWP